MDSVEIALSGATAAEEGGVTRALVVGVEHLELLEAAAETAGRVHCDRSFAARCAKRARFCRASWIGLSSGAGGEFTGVVCERYRDGGRAVRCGDARSHRDPGQALDGMLKFGQRGLTADGRLWLFERYESLESPREKVVEHPIGRLRRMLGEVGLSCERLNPIEADGDHVLAAVALPARAASRGSGTVSAA